MSLSGLGLGEREAPPRLHWNPPACGTPRLLPTREVMRGLPPTRGGKGGGGVEGCSESCGKEEASMAFTLPGSAFF